MKKIFIFSGYLNIKDATLDEKIFFANTMHLKEEKFRGNRGENELTNLHMCVEM